MTEKRWIRMMEFCKKTGCHQMPERSFFIHGWQLPLCSRCCGVISGWAAAVTTAFVIIPPFWLMPLLCLPMLIDWYLQSRCVIKNNNPRRFFTGLLGGWALMNIYIRLIIILISLFC